MSNIFSIHALPAAYGDALWIEYGPSENPRRILVDAGTPGTFPRLEPMLQRVAEQYDRPFELLVVTHIDADHIGGVLPIVEDPHLGHLFKDIWFNGRAQLAEASRLEPHGVAQGERLTKALFDNGLPWNRAFGGEPVVAGPHGEPVEIDLAEGMKCTLLSPTREQLERLLPEWDKEVRQAGLIRGRKPRKQLPSTELEAMGASKIRALAKSPFKQDAALANGSSIAFILEYRGRRMLLGADAFPSVLLRASDHLGGEAYPVEVFKVPHHGSKGNVSNEVLDRFPSAAYLISTNGDLFHHPDREAIARIAARDGHKKLIFNYSSKYSRFWKQAREQYDYEAFFGKDAGIKVPVQVD